jgi:hypothetical protein
LHVATWIEGQTRTHAAPTVKQRLAAIRHLFDWLVTGQIVATNPAGSVRGPAYSVKTGKTPVLEAEEARRLLDSIDTRTPAGLRDRALMALMVYSFARIGAALGMKVEDAYTPASFGLPEPPDLFEYLPMTAPTICIVAPAPREADSHPPNKSNFERSSPGIAWMASASAAAVSAASVNPLAEPSRATSSNGTFWASVIIACWSLAFGPSATSQTLLPGFFAARLAAS